MKTHLLLVFDAFLTDSKLMAGKECDTDRFFQACKDIRILCTCRGRPFPFPFDGKADEDIWAKSLCELEYFNGSYWCMYIAE